jgi:hypothetical protein
VGGSRGIKRGREIGRAAAAAAPNGAAISRFLPAPPAVNLHCPPQNPYPPPPNSSFYLLFQHHSTPRLARCHGLFGGRGYSQIVLLGPRVAALLPDQRAERTTQQVGWWWGVGAGAAALLFFPPHSWHHP